MRNKSRAFVALLVVLASAGAAAKPQSYRHDEYGFEVRMPEGAARCAPDKYSVDDGELFYLDKSHIDCRTIDYHEERTISINGVPNGSNDTGEPDTLDGYYQQYCELNDGCTGEHPKLSIAGQAVRTGQTKGNNGRLDIFVLYQHGENPHFKGKHLKANNIAVVLSTDAAHEAGDLKALKQLLATLRIYNEPH